MDTTGLILLSSALALAISLSLVRKKEYNFTTVKALVFTVLTCLFGFVGTKLLYMLEHLEYGILFNGVSFFGSVFFIPIAMFVLTRFTKDSFGKCMDFFGPYILPTVGIMRIGCYIGGCCGAHRIIFMGQQIVPPIQLVEFVFDFVIFIALLLYHQKYCKNETGTLYPKVMIGYSFVRLIMEHYRDTDKDVIGMSRGQWYAITAFIVGIIVLAVLKAIRLKHQTQKEQTK